MMGRVVDLTVPRHRAEPNEDFCRSSPSIPTARLGIKAALTGLQAGRVRVPDQVAVVPAVADGNPALFAC
jgi:hypothetical protein